VAERDLAVVAGEDIETQERDRIDDHHRELQQPIAAYDERKQAGEDQQRHNRGDPQGASAGGGRGLREVLRQVSLGEGHGQTLVMMV
jgi:hypothetical protein